MKTETKNKLASPLYAFVALTIASACTVISANGSSISPWADPNQPIQTHYWEYDFNDGQLPPTVTSEAGNWDPGSDPVFTFSGSGDQVSVFTNPYANQLGMGLGVKAVTQNSHANIYLRVPNEQNPDNIKKFWFAFDWCGAATAPLVTAGTDEVGYTVSPITGYDELYHVEGYVTINPQPRSEWLNIELSVDQGKYMWIDNLQVGSNCEVIPEPASAALLLLLFPLMIVRRNLCSDKKQGAGKLYMSINKLFSYFYQEA